MIQVHWNKSLCLKCWVFDCNRSQCSPGSHYKITFLVAFAGKFLMFLILSLHSSSFKNEGNDQDHKVNLFMVLKNISNNHFIQSWTQLALHDCDCNKLKFKCTHLWEMVLFYYIYCLFIPQNRQKHISYGLISECNMIIYRISYSPEIHLR